MFGTRKKDSQQTNFNLEDFGLVAVSICDLHGIARGRFVSMAAIPSVVKNGLGMEHADLFAGVKTDTPTQLTEFAEDGFSNCNLLPDLATLRPVPWLSYGNRKVGDILCDMYDNKLNVEESSSRQVAHRQLKALENLGYIIVMSTVLECSIFQQDITCPVGIHDDISQLVALLITSLQTMGIPVTDVSQTSEAGKLQISLGDQHGMEAADNLHRLRNAVRSVCDGQGYDVTFMTAPMAEVSGNNIHYKVTLLTKDGRNAFTEDEKQSQLSSIAYCWLAGCLSHHRAMCALGRPTLNCYRESLSSTWTSDETDRSSRLKVQVSDAGISILDRLPTTASNPYLVLAATVAAGMDGIVRKLESPGQGKVPETIQADQQTPRTLEDALQALEQDDTLRNAFGNTFVNRYTVLKRDFEINRTEDIKRFDDSLEYERFLYLLL